MKKMKPIWPTCPGSLKRVVVTVLVLSALILSGCTGQAAMFGRNSVAEIFPGDLFPPAVPAKHDGFPLATACPNPAGLERPTRVDVAELLRAVSEHIIAVAKGDEEQARKKTDQAFWPMLGSLRTGQGGNPGDVQPLDQSRVARFGPASESPHAELIKNNCGEETLKASWWIQTLPAGNGNVSASQSLKGNFYLINRKGHWLIWGSE